MASARSNSRRVAGGPGVRVRRMPDGDLVSFKGTRAIFLNPFKVGLIGDTAAEIRPGLVSTVPVTIGGIPLEGDDDHAPPTLEWDTPQVDGDGRGYIAIETTHSAKDWSIAQGQVEVVQVAYLDRDSATAAAPSILLGGTPILPGRRSRHPLAMLRLRKSGQLDLYQICFFNLQVRVQVGTLASGASREDGRAFYWPA